MKQKKPVEIEMALDQLKMEIAQELGIDLRPDGYNGHLTTREVGLLGGNMVRMLVAIAMTEFNGMDAEDLHREIGHRLYNK
jgi:hypothetical protein